VDEPQRDPLTIALRCQIGAQAPRHAATQDVRGRRLDEIALLVERSHPMIGNGT